MADEGSEGLEGGALNFEAFGGLVEPVFEGAVFGEVEEVGAPAVVAELDDDGAGGLGAGFLEGMGEVGAEEVYIAGVEGADVVADEGHAGAFGK